MKNQRRKNDMPYVISIVLFCVFAAQNVQAHRVNVFAWVEGNRVFTESTLSRGKAVSGGDITVYDSSNRILLKGKTDDQGEFTFILPQKPPLIIELNAGMGHRAQWTLLPDDADGNASSAEGDAAGMEPKPETVFPLTENGSHISVPQLEAALERALDKQLKPIIRMLVDNGNEPSLTDIIGGIGYIFGIFGIIAYLRARSLMKKD
ncbi:MAG: hypothetical protein R6U50_17740 [Desulfobacterales bacterium]